MTRNLVDDDKKTHSRNSSDHKPNEPESEYVSKGVSHYLTKPYGTSDGTFHGVGEGEI